jgi:protein ImuA
MTAQSHAAPPLDEGVPRTSPACPGDRQDTLAELEQRYPGLWRAGQLGQAANLPVLPTGYDALSAELPGGGWPVGALTELLHADSGMGELRLLRPALQSLVRGGRRLMLVGPPYAPNAMSLATWGLPAQQVYWVRAAQANARNARQAQADVLWAAEQVLRSQAFGGVLVWLPGARPEAVRRLQVLAQASEAAVWVSRPATALRESSPAVLRLLLSPVPGNALSITFHKRRGPVRETPLVLSLGEMPAVPGRARPSIMPATPVPAAPSIPVAPVLEGGHDHAVLDRGASAAPVAGRAAAELA